MNWFGGLSTAIMDDNPPLNVRKLENLRIFLDSVNRSVTLVGGRVTVVAIPQGSGQEEIVAFAAWVPPHKVIEDRALNQNMAENNRGLQTDHRLEITATDPDYQGKGYCRLLMKEGFSTCQSKPITLEATTAHSRDVYAHLGFEVVESLTLGKGQVNNRGLRIAKREPATGFPWPSTDVTENAGD
ncbi:hypothetical protein B0H16DRAFT_1462538 [Mycena metata]|uniref:N-acetyltransferase domain-containing protein n=1 Tax=Mycena metata TaxID=1033252 RepID=A0AAD7IM69_9AGAR|nr:hypothetical protein B0H16DRAFT_1462538 [Mycena metata]